MQLEPCLGLFSCFYHMTICKEALQITVMLNNEYQHQSCTFMADSCLLGYPAICSMSTSGMLRASRGN